MIPTTAGIYATATISFLLLFIVASKMPRIRLKHGSLSELRYFSIISLIYFFLWFGALITAQVVFGLNITPVLSTIAISCIILPYVFVIILHIFGFTMKFSW